MRREWTMIGVSVALFAACFLNYRPWRGYSSDRKVEIIAEPIRIAHNLLVEGEFRDPFGALPTGRTAHIAPGLPFLQFLVLKTLGDGARGWLALQTLPVLALSLGLALLPWAARWIGLSAWAGVLAAIFGLLTKPGAEPQWEAHLAGLLSLLLFVSVYRFETHRPSTLFALATGVLAGVIFLLQPVVALPYLCWIALLMRRRDIRGRVAMLIAMPLAISIPWSVRNYRELGTPGMRDNLGLELYVSFNDCASYSFEENLKHRCHETFHPNSSIREAEQVRALGEYNYNRERFHIALNWIRSHAEAAGTLIAQRFWFFWFPSTEGFDGYRRQRARWLYLHAFTLASLVGIYLIWKQRLPCAPYFSIFLATFPLIYYLHESAPRYRYPILWITLLLAAHAILTLCSHAFRARQSR
jgi:hypothetical protein